MSGRGTVGARTGGKGSWRRKGKKQPHGDNLEAQKIWAAAQRLINNRIFQLDLCLMIGDLKDNDALSFNKPELLCDQRANTYIIHGKPEKKPMTEVFQDLFSNIDFSKFGKDKANEEAGENDLGDIPQDLDFSKPTEEGEAKADEEKKGE